MGNIRNTMMNKTIKKTLSVALCIAFSGLQMSLADVLTGGTFAGRDVLNGTGAQIKGHTAGLTGLTTNGMDATLVFGANTRIDWNKLNVDKGQSLYFNNGNYGVLNNVVGGSISKFAGLIKADNGKIVISNPNGILFQGGKFESLGGLVLTAAKYQDMRIDENTNFNSLDFSRSAEDYCFGNVNLLDNTVIHAGDIEIHGYGVKLDKAELVSEDSVLITADGKSYYAFAKQEKPDLTTKEQVHRQELMERQPIDTSKIAEYNSSTEKPVSGVEYARKKVPASVSDKVNFEKIDALENMKIRVTPGLSIANSAITAKDGTITLVSSRGIYSDPAIQYNAATTNMTAQDDIYAGGVYYGDLNATSNEHIILDGQVLGTGNFEAAGITIWCSGVGNLVANDTTEDGIGVNLWNSVVGDAEVSTPDEFAMQDSGMRNANITAKDVKIACSEVAGNLDIEATDSVYIARNVSMLKDVNIKADKVEVGTAKGPETMHSDVFYGEKNQYEFTYEFTGGSSYPSSTKVGGDFTAEANDLNVNGLSANGDVTLTSENDINVKNIAADADKNGEGDLTITSEKNVEVENVSGYNVNLESKTADVKVNGAEATNDIIVNALEGNPEVRDAHADSDNDKHGDLIINGKTVTVDDVSGENVKINATEDVNAKDVTGADDVIINAGNEVNGENLVADGDEDGIGDLIINAGKDVNLDGGEGSNIYIETKEGSVNADNLTADGDDSIGNGKIVIIAPNGDVDVNGADANGNVEVTIGNGDLNLKDVNPDTDGNGVGQLIVNRLGADDEALIDGSIADEVVKNMNNLSQTGIETDSQSFSPVAFAADDDDDEASLAKRIAKIVYKTPSNGVVTITDKLQAQK